MDFIHEQKEAMAWLVLEYISGGTIIMLSVCQNLKQGNCWRTSRTWLNSQLRWTAYPAGQTQNKSIKTEML